MTVFQKPADIVAAARALVATSIIQLDLPPMSSDPRPVQSYNLFKDDHFHVLSPDRHFHSHMVVVSAIFDPSRNRRTLHCNDVNTGQPVPFDDEQLAVLERDGRLRMLKPEMKGLPKSPVSLDEVQTAVAKRIRGYVMAAVDQGFKEGKEPDNEGVMARAIAKHAAKIHDLDPICTKTLRKYVAQLGRWHEQDLRAFLPRVSMGNSSAAFQRLGVGREASKEIEELIKQCVIAIHSQANPRLSDLKNLLIKMLELPEHSHLMPLVIGPDRNIRTSDATLYRRMGELNRYDRDREHLGDDKAHVRRRNRASRRLPERPLDIVDVDYTQLDIVVYDPRYKFIYGRPYVIIFRDRASGAILGFSVFFENASFEALWHGLRRTIFPKDMSAYPGRRWSMYGFMAQLVVDNDATLISEAAFILQADLGINVRQARVARPTDKPGIEQFFAKLRNAVILNLPGSTGKNPDDRAEFGDEKQKGMPFLDLDMLDAGMVEYICTEVHAKPLTGFLRGAQTSEEIWEKGIALTKNRPLFNPEEMLRISGFKVKVVIRGNSTVRWKHIEYFSLDLAAITENSGHVEREYDDDNSSPYEAYLNPSDLGYITVINPFDKGSVIEVPASDAWRSYASGLRRFQHETNVQHYRTVFREKIKGVSDLERAAKHLTEDMKHLVERLKTQKAMEKFAAYHSNMSDRVVLGRMVDVAPSASVSEDFLDPEDAVESAPVRYSETSAPSVKTLTVPKEVFVLDGNGNLVREDVMKHAAPKGKPAPEDGKKLEKPKKRDIEALRKMHKGWD